ncbi:MAG: pyridoxal-phosphate dependent enzyme [Actinobacteria bacterium]|nr:pyridoxal-phosphate dependent enzyme [Actinomycetota bacterium]
MRVRTARPGSRRGCDQSGDMRLPAAPPPVAGGGAGWTPLARAPRLASAPGIGELYLKLDLANATHSFKDRVVAVAAAKAPEFGADTLACASTGNLGNAVAARAAGLGMRDVQGGDDYRALCKLSAVACFRIHLHQHSGASFRSDWLLRSCAPHDAGAVMRAGVSGCGQHHPRGKRASGVGKRL